MNPRPRPKRKISKKRHPKGYDPSKRCETKQSQESQPKRDEINGTEHRRMLNEAKQDMRKRVPGSRKPESSDPSPPSEILRIAGEPHPACACSPRKETPHKKSATETPEKASVCNDESRAARQVLQSIRRRGRGKFKLSPVLPSTQQTPQCNPNCRQKRPPVQGTEVETRRCLQASLRPNHQHISTPIAPQTGRSCAQILPPPLARLLQEKRLRKRGEVSLPEAPLRSHARSRTPPTLALALAQTRERGNEGGKVAPPRAVSPSDSSAGKGQSCACGGNWVSAVFRSRERARRGKGGKGGLDEGGSRCEEARQAEGGRRREDGEREDEGEEGGRRGGWHAESEIEGRWGSRPRRGKKAKEGVRLAPPLLYAHAKPVLFHISVGVSARRIAQCGLGAIVLSANRVVNFMKRNRKRREGK
ncbi:hypothetical protein B0H14DRAFT_3133439 [Mycena olivaceomarginata]|nr:hypothetical protein B0H14DRAFT_3133439 [Mycena olivaceomarginata]